MTEFRYHMWKCLAARCGVEFTYLPMCGGKSCNVPKWCPECKATIRRLEHVKFVVNLETDVNEVHQVKVTHRKLLDPKGEKP